MTILRPLLASLILSLCCLCLPLETQAAGDAFVTQKLKEMATLLRLQRLDTLSAGTDNRTSYSFGQRKLHLRKNQWGEVSHIGFALFHPEMANGAERPVFDFLERFALEYALANAEMRSRLLESGVAFWTGNIRTLQTLNGEEALSIGKSDFSGYQMAWTRDGKEILSITFPMDAQLIMGCNIIELEKHFARSVVRKRNASPLLPGERAEAETFIIDAIRSQLFWTKGEDGKEELVWDAAQWRKSLYNLMLSGCEMGDYRLQLVLDKYGYQSETLNIPVTQWAQFCRDEGCRLYLGIKEVANGEVKATIFAANASCGYCHTMSISIPQSSLGGTAGVVKARIYCYIPLHNIPHRLFENSSQYR